MTREIKFRAWCQYTKSFRYVKDADDFSWWASSRNGPGCNISKIGLMQFTGLHDKNGVEIYEGDIVQYGCKSNHSIRYDVAYCDWRMYDLKIHTYLRLGEHSYNELEVIGNIYENPELLED